MIAVVFVVRVVHTYLFASAIARAIAFHHLKRGKAIEEAKSVVLDIGHFANRWVIVVGVAVGNAVGLEVGSKVAI